MASIMQPAPPVAALSAGAEMVSAAGWPPAADAPVHKVATLSISPCLRPPRHGLPAGATRETAPSSAYLSVASVGSFLVAGAVVLRQKRRRQPLDESSRLRRIHRRVTELPSALHKVVGKKELKKTISWVLQRHGNARTKKLLDKLKVLGFSWATQAGISLGVEDLRVPPAKAELVEATNDRTLRAEERYENGEITVVERFLKVTDEWSRTTEDVKSEAVQNFKDNDPMNSVFMMSTSGARGSISQVRQLVAMRGLMADANGQLIDVPIRHNLREGMTVTDMLISSNGARKGVIDTALRTADAGYLYRRLDFTGADMIVRAQECGTETGVDMNLHGPPGKCIANLADRIRGRVLAEDIVDPVSEKVLFKKSHLLTFPEALDVHSIWKKHDKEGVKVPPVVVRSSLRCKLQSGVCAMCYGEDLSTPGKLVALHHPVGTIAAQSLGEPGTQLTMRTFHTGGAFEGGAGEGIRAKCKGVVHVRPVGGAAASELHGRWLRKGDGDVVLILEKEACLQLTTPEDDTVVQEEQLTPGTRLHCTDGSTVSRGQVLFERPPKNYSPDKDASGSEEAFDEAKVTRIVKDVVSNEAGEVLVEVPDISDASMSLPAGSHVVWVLQGYNVNMDASAKRDLAVQHGQQVQEGDPLVTEWTKARTGGVPRAIPRPPGSSTAAVTTVGEGVRQLDWLQEEAGGSSSSVSMPRSEKTTSSGESDGEEAGRGEERAEFVTARSDYDWFKLAGDAVLKEYSAREAVPSPLLPEDQGTVLEALENVPGRMAAFVRDEVAVERLQPVKGLPPVKVQTYTKSPGQSADAAVGFVAASPSQGDVGMIRTASRVAHPEHVVPCGGLVFVVDEGRSILWSPEVSYSLENGGAQTERLLFDRRHGQLFEKDEAVCAGPNELFKSHIKGHLCIYGCPRASSSGSDVVQEQDGALHKQSKDRYLCASSLPESSATVECVLKPGSIVEVPNSEIEENAEAWYSILDGRVHPHQRLLRPGHPVLASRPEWKSDSEWLVVELLDDPRAKSSTVSRVLVRPTRRLEVPDGTVDSSLRPPCTREGGHVSTWYTPFSSGEIVKTRCCYSTGKVAPVALVYELVNSVSRHPEEQHAVSIGRGADGAHAERHLNSTADRRIEEQATCWSGVDLVAVQHLPPTIMRCDVTGSSWQEPEPRFLTGDKAEESTQQVPLRVLQSPCEGYVCKADSSSARGINMMMLRAGDFLRVPCSSKPFVTLGDVVRQGHSLSASDKAPHAGQVMMLEEMDGAFFVTLRRAWPHLVKNGTLNVRTGEFVQQGDVLAKEELIVPKTADIVQGLPKITKLFEAAGDALSSRLDELWESFRTSGHGDFVAALHARAQLQDEMVNEVQSTYGEQGVGVNSKHLEVIISRLTATCTVLDSGGTSLNPGQEVDYGTVEALRALRSSSDIRVRPRVKGLTQVGLDSHVMVAMSFREVDNVITNDVLAGEGTYAMRGIKENLMMGKAISVGKGAGDDGLRRGDVEPATLDRVGNNVQLHTVPERCGAPLI
eukprot:TRINITY_DN24471_c0_g4_i1.p1 TRINITY_DN24471_c0_g4~~TRINITY_DN24471_c0_g4_i1.p1  ORF type:complete len:1515 (-),score=366.29 TRINITY_DN24471_c0_g4_i1:126-4670(-)